MWGVHSESSMHDENKPQVSDYDENVRPEKSHVSGIINELDGDVLANVNGGVIASNVDERTRSLPLLQYTYYADIQRGFEQKGDWDGLRETQEKQLIDPHSNLSTEKIDSQRRLRRASKYAVFFLITTDILGPSNAPYAMSKLGYVAGIILYISFGIFACLGGKMLNYVFLKLDSDNYPVRTFSDLASRLFGPWCRYAVAILHFIQLILNVGIICLTTGQALGQGIQSTKDDPKLCFTIQILVWALLGMILGQIRSLRDFSHLANSAVWMNIAICIITMVGAAIYAPYYPAQSIPNVTPITHSAGLPFEYNDAGFPIGRTNLNDQMLGVDQMVFAWGGATIFCEVMAEMANPRDFVKGMVGADILIGVVYLFFGIFVYTYQGQYTNAVANQGIQTYGLRLAANILSIVSGMLAAVLYGNIGLKVLYQGFAVPDMKFPKLTTWRGAIVWGVLVIVYWGVAFVIAAAIPQVATLSSLLGSLCILNFSYTFPAAFMLGWLIHEDASVKDIYDPQTARVQKFDSWRQLSRWKRAFAHGGWKRQLAKIFLLIMFLGGLCLCAIGLYGAIQSMIDVYNSNSAGSKPFSCNPANYN